MPLRPYVPDVRRYDDVFLTQMGAGVAVRYRGSPYQNGSGLGSFFRTLLSKVGNFVSPLLKQAVPHAKAALEAAKPHLQEAAQGALREVTSQATQAIAKKFAPQTQEGSGKGRKGVTKKKKNQPRRIPPYHLPDSF